MAIKSKARSLGIRKNPVINSKPKYILKDRVYKKDPTNFFKIWTPEMAYILGLMTTDGNVSYNAFMIQLHPNDIKLLQNISNIMLGEDIVYIKNGTHNDLAHFRFNNRTCIVDLYDLGIHENKTFTVKPPENIPDDMKKYYSLGLIDGDGCLFFTTKRRKRFELIFCGNFYMTNFLKKYIYQVTGYNPNILVYKKYKNKENKIYNVRINSKYTTEFFMKYLYENSNLFLERKYLVYKNYLEFKNKQLQS